MLYPLMSAITVFTCVPVIATSAFPTLGELLQVNAQCFNERPRDFLGNTDKHIAKQPRKAQTI